MSADTITTLAVIGAYIVGVPALAIALESRRKPRPTRPTSAPLPLHSPDPLDMDFALGQHLADAQSRILGSPRATAAAAEWAEDER